MVCEKSRRPLLKSVILVVPVNTVANWENEFRKWADHLDPSIRVSNLTDVNRNARPTAIRGWENRGGILLLSDSLFTRLMGQDEYKDRLQCDILVLDEAHTTLSNKTNASYKALSSVRTPRRIALTGSPVQNNLLEYYMMVNWIRPNIFGMTESMFEKTFVIPITKGMASDAPKISVYNSMSQSKLLNEMLLPYVQRKDATELMKDLPPMQQVVLHIRQSRMQCRLYRYFQKFQKTPDGDSYKNFFSMYTALRPIHNHPGCLMLSSDKTSQTNASKKDNENNYAGLGGGEATSSSSWWMNLFKKESPEKLKEVENGFKIVLLLHILTISERLGDKVLVFSQCLKTLDFIEEVLARANWSEHVSSLASSFPGKQMGSWKKGTDYLRIDGDINSAERGGLVDQFNNGEKNGDIRAFLISSKAGGMGINLPAANRVVLFDSHFNPTVTTQAVFRAYRYGQEKDVFVYRLLTEGSIEEKVYSRSVNKTGVAIRVVDGKSIKRSFTAKEVEAMQENLTWVQCDKCEKWRMLPSDVSEEDLPEKWLCKMNLFDVRNNTCDAPERDQLWYERHLYSTDAELSESPMKCMASDPIDSLASQRAKKKLVSNDVILEHLLDVTERQKKTTMISKFYFHEALLESTKDSTEEIEDMRDAIEAENTTAEAIEAEKTSIPSSTQSTSPKDSARATKASSNTKPYSKTSSSPTKNPASATTTSMAATGTPSKKVSSNTKPSFKTSSSPTKTPASATTTSIVATGIVETSVKQKVPDASEVALEKAKASVTNPRVLKEKTPDTSEVALGQVKASPSKRAALKRKTLDVSKVAAVVKPTETSSKHTPSKPTLSARSSPRRSRRHMGSSNTKKERPPHETDRGLKRGLSPDTSLVSNQKDEPTPSKKHGRWTGSSRDSSSPSTLKQRGTNDLLDMDPPADMSERGSVGKKATPKGITKKPRSIFTENGKKGITKKPRSIFSEYRNKETRRGRAKKPRSTPKDDSAASPSPPKYRSKEAKAKARSKSLSKEAKPKVRSWTDSKPAPSNKPPTATEIIDLT
jgi:ERCC4-related helicase